MAEQTIGKTEEMDLVVIKNPIMKKLLAKAIRKPIIKALGINDNSFALSIGDTTIDHDGTDINFNIKLHGRIDSSVLYSILKDKGVI